jgi:hypothetical protein
LPPSPCIYPTVTGCGLLASSYSTGSYSTGSYITGSYNTGSYSTGSYNTGSYNTGSYSTGSYNTGSYNTGSYNTGSYNTGSYNTGSYNTGSYSTGSYNTGSYNTGSYNTGSYSTGSYNTGSYSTGSYSTGSYNTGSYNTGSYKATTPALCMTCSSAAHLDAAAGLHDLQLGCHLSHTSLCDAVEEHHRGVPHKCCHIRGNARLLWGWPINCCCWTQCRCGLVDLSNPESLEALLSAACGGVVWCACWQQQRWAGPGVSCCS